MSFDLANKTKKGLYRIKKTKGKKERLVYIPKKVIRELRKSNWKPNQTNRFNFYHFLKKIKRELNIGKGIELSPHILRHAFTTYHAENGLSLPILAKMLGHVSVRTTALYWQNIHQEPDNDNIGPILAGKKWLERQEPPKPPITENFAPPNKITMDYLFPQTPKTPNPVFIDQKPVISNKKPIHQDNSLSTPKTLKKNPGMLTNEILPRIPEKFLLNSPNKKNDQLKTSQPLTQKPTESEVILLAKIKRLEEQLKQVQAENKKLKFGKEKAEQLAQHERKRANQLEIKLKTVAQILCQLQKINYYKQLDQEQKAQIEQPLLKPPNT